MEEILQLTEQSETIATEATTELEILEQINSNLVMIGTIENLILGVLCIFLLYGLYKTTVKFFSWFI